MDSNSPLQKALLFLESSKPDRNPTIPLHHAIHVVHCALDCLPEQGTQLELTPPRHIRSIGNGVVKRTAWIARDVLSLD